MSHINGRVRRWAKDSKYEPRPGRPGRTNWTALNGGAAPAGGGASGGDSSGGDAAGWIDPADNYDVTMRCRLDLAALRYLSERASSLGLEILDVRPPARRSAGDTERDRQVRRERWPETSPHRRPDESGGHDA